MKPRLPVTPDFIAAPLIPLRNSIVNICPKELKFKHNSASNTPIDQSYVNDSSS